MKSTFTFIILLLLFSITGFLNAQEVIVTDDAAYTTSATGAVLDVKSTTKGIIIPRMTTAQRNTLGNTTPANGVVVYDTDLKAFWYWDNAQWNQIAASGLSSNFKFGDASNYSQFEADGTLMMYGNATSWNDLVVNPSTARNSGGSAPSWAQFASTNIYAWFFADAQTNEVVFTVQLPHDYKQGSAVYPHIHWSSTTAPALQRVRWVMEYQWSNHTELFSATTTTSVSGYEVVGGSSTNLAAYRHNITPFGSIDGTGKTISSIIICRLYRDGSHTNDNFTNTAALFSVDFHYQVDSFGSHTEFSK